MPPASGPEGFDPLEMCIARSLVHDVSLTLCKSRLYEVIAPFTARRLAGSRDLAAFPAVASDFQVRTQVNPSLSRDLYAVLSLDLVVT